MALNRNKLRGHIATQPYGKNARLKQKRERSEWKKSEKKAKGKKEKAL